MSDYPMLISNKLHSFRNFLLQKYKKSASPKKPCTFFNLVQNCLFNPCGKLPAKE